MKIVLMADMRKYDLLINFCIAYKQILQRQNLYSMFNTSHLISEATKLEINTMTTYSETNIEQLAARVNYNEIDAIIYLRDQDAPNYSLPNTLLRACDKQNVPYATNLAMAELLILAIDRGDLDWRELVK
ncbi:MAG: methylglyoxal synthase [Eubacteriales bacterium]|nr:methylglyoxal synthase [Eubacteriales bacterium]